jgi:nucleotide-binding universal stress UspA family protein
MTTSGKPVLAGVDAFPQSAEAALWATAEARLRRADLHLVMVNDNRAVDDELAAVLRDVAARCRHRHPEVRVSEQIVQGHVASELVQRSPDAQLLVVGARGRQGPADGMGSASTIVATRARCPVTVVHAPHTEFTGGPVVVGFDDSQQSGLALRFALDTATRRHTDVLAVLVLRDIRAEYSWTGQSALDINWKRWRDEALRHLGKQLTAWAEEYPDITFRREVRRGYPTEELSAASGDAQMLVVGHHGLGGVPMGSVASGVLQIARCPVTVVH